jgi:hypothetical protein
VARGATVAFATGVTRVNVRWSDWLYGTAFSALESFYSLKGERDTMDVGAPENRIVIPKNLS